MIGKVSPEFKIRELIHETSILTFPKPKGIPENYSADTGSGLAQFFCHSDQLRKSMG